MPTTRMPSPLRFGSQWSSWVIITAVLALLLLIALMAY
jgi:hypothetical protein